MASERKRKRLRSGATSGVRKRGRSLVSQSGANATVCIVSAGQTLSERYELIREISRTELGVVYEAIDHTLNELHVAVKVLPPELSGSPKAQKRMRQEAVATLQLAHPNILRLYSFERDGTTVYLVTELLSGPTLAEVLENNPTIPLEQVLELAKDLCSALDYAHSAGVIHRDVRPETIVWAEEQKGRRARLTEFGVARQLSDAMTQLTGVTEPESLLYISPEQLKGQTTDALSDQYALAVILYELLSVPPLFEDDSLQESIINEEPRPIEGLSDEFNAALLKALKKDPAQRYKDCGEFFKSLEKAAPTQEKRATPPPVPKPKPKAKPAPKAAAKPAPKATTKPTKKPVTKPVAKPKPKPAPKSVPTSKSKNISDMIKSENPKDFHRLAGTDKHGEISFIQKRVYQFMRVLAVLFDYTAIGLLTCPAFFLLGFFESEMSSYERDSTVLFVLSFYLIYMTLRDCWGGSASFGKRLVGLRTINGSWGPSSFFRSIIRNFLPFGLGLFIVFVFTAANEDPTPDVFSVLMGLYWFEAAMLTIFFSTRRMGDFLAGTRVVYEKGIDEKKRGDFSMGCLGAIFYLSFLYGCSIAMGAIYYANH